MSLGTENGLSVADIAAVTDRNNGNGGFGMGGDWLIALVMLFLFPMFYGNGMWGGGMFGGMGGWANGGMAAMANGALTRADLCSEFNFNGLENSVRAVQQGLCDGFYAMNTTMLQGFHGVDNAICSLGNTMQQGFNATQVAMMQGQNALQAQLADCCCKNQVGQMQIQNQMAADTCAVTNTIQNTTRDVIDNQNSNARAILDALNQNYVRTLENENQSLKLAASQATQNSVIGARIDAATAEILRKTGAECPAPCYVVQPPAPVTFPTNCCGQATGFSGGNCGGCCA